MLKRIIALLLTGSLAFTPISGFATTETVPTLPATQTIENANTLKTLNLVNGDARGLRLDEQLSRAESLVLIIKLLGDQDKLKNTDLKTFKDVKSTDWFAPYVAYASKNGIALGINKDQFAPNAPVNEKQFLKMLLSAMHYEIGKDFTWESIESFAASKGYVVSAASEKSSTNSAPLFNRSNAFDFTFTALKQAPKDEKVTILEKLISTGKIDYKLLEQPAIAKTIDKKLIEAIQTNISPKATSTTAPTTVVPTTVVPTTQTPQTSSTAPASGGTSGGGSFSGGGSSGGSSSGGSSSGGGSSTTPTPTPPNPTPVPPTPVNPVLPAKEVSLENSLCTNSYFDLFFTEELDAKSAETVGVVTLSYEFSNGRNIDYITKKSKYFTGEKKLRVSLESVVGYCNTFKVSINPTLLKTSTGNAVKMEYNTCYFLGKPTLLRSIYNTETQLTIGFATPLENLTNLNQIQVINETTHTSVPIKQFEFDPAKTTLSLTANEIPKDAIIKIVFSNISLDYQEEHHTNYETMYHTTRRLVPQIEKIDFETPQKLQIYFNEEIQQSDINNITNYKLYRNTVTKENQVPIESVRSYFSIYAELSVKNLETNATYIVVVDNMTTKDNIESIGSLQYTFNGPIYYSDIYVRDTQLTVDNNAYIIYSGAVDQATALNPENYSVFSTDKDHSPNLDVTVKPTKVTYDALNDVYLLSFTDTSFMNGELAMIQPDLTRIKDTLGKPLRKNADTYYDLHKQQMNAPIQFAYVTTTSASSISFDSNLALDLSTVNVLENYSIKDDNGNPVKIHKVTLTGDRHRFTLDVDPVFKNNCKYNLVISNLKALSKQTMPNSITIEFMGKSLDQTAPTITHSEHVTSEVKQ